MPEINFNEKCTEAVASVLETMFFTAPMGLAEEEAGGDAVEARLAFRGSPSGVFTLRVSVSGARLLASGFLGAEEDALSQPQTEQVICELANMLCGSFVSQLKSSESFNLSAPELVACGTPQEACQGTSAVRQSFELESGILTVALHLEEA